MTDDRQSPGVLNLGERLYSALSIIEEPDPQHNPEFGIREPIEFEYFVFPKSFKESFNARWETGKRSYGRLNPMYYYGGTEREANISFTLPAMTVHESAQNLRKCSELSRAVYGRYRDWNFNLYDDGISDFTMVGARYFRVNFGNLIMNERAFISSFSFSIDPDAGIFDYTERDWSSAAAALESLTSGANPVNSQIWQEVLPRQIDVQISIIFRHDYALGFGGANRVGHPDKWAANDGKEFPHGTGEIDEQPYMSRTEDTTIQTRTEAQARAAAALEVHAAADAAAQDAQAAAWYETMSGGESSPSDCSESLVFVDGCNSVPETDP